MMFQDNVGKWGVGSPKGIPPNLLPMVSTGKLNAVTTAVPKTSATIDPGTCLCQFFPDGYGN